MKTQKKIMVLLPAILCMCSFSAYSAECKVTSGGTPFNIQNGTSNNIYVDLKPTSDTYYTYGDLDIYCRYGANNNSNPGEKDFWATFSADSFTLPFSGYTGGLFINNVPYNIPVPGSIRIAEMPSSSIQFDPYGPWVKLNISPFITKSNKPNSIQVAANQSLGRIIVRQTANFNSSDNMVVLNLLAAKNITLWPNTCAINGGGVLDIDFGSVIDSKISTDPISPGEYTKPVSLTYSCSDTRVTQAISITLQATKTAPFNNRLIGTSNSNLGVAMVKTSSLVGVNSSYNSQMVNGQGTDSISFNLVRNSAQLPETGAFNATAVIQIGLP